MIYHRNGVPEKSQTFWGEEEQRSVVSFFAFKRKLNGAKFATTRGLGIPPQQAKA